jgi:hypothetical protein
MRSRKISERCEENPVVRTGGEVFSDGSILDLVRIPTGELSFVFWDGKSAETSGQFARQGETFVPPKIDPTILRSLQLPASAVEYGSTRKLFTEISSLISQVTEGTDGVVELLASFVLATWLKDFLPFAPFLWIVTPPAATSAPLAQMLKVLCRHALVVDDISSAGFRSLPMDLRPTLLTEIFQPSRRELNLLRASTRSGALIAVGGKVIDASCAKIVFAPEPLRDPASAGFPLELVLPAAREYIPLMGAAETERIAAEYQAKLLCYRLANSAKVQTTPAFDLGKFTVVMQQVAHSLSASIVDDDELQVQIVRLLESVDGEIRVSHTSLLLAIVVEALLARCHITTGRYLPVGDLTQYVNSILLCRGDMHEVSPETVGWSLRALGLRTDFIPGGRKGLILDGDMRKKIHRLAGELWRPYVA